MKFKSDFMDTLRTYHRLPLVSPDEGLKLSNQVDMLQQEVESLKRKLKNATPGKAPSTPKPQEITVQPMSETSMTQGSRGSKKDAKSCRLF